MRRRGVEATRIGVFTGAPECLVTYDGTPVVQLDMDFLHSGLPKKPMTTRKPPRIEIGGAPVVTLTPRV